MKKTVLLSFLSATMMASAQVSIPNGGFENWSNDNFSVNGPTGWRTLNIYSSLLNQNPYSVSKTTDAFSGTSAALIQNIPTKNDLNQDSTIGGYAACFLPIKDKKLPSLLKGKIKYNFPAGEKGIITVGYVGATENTTTTIYNLGFKILQGSVNDYTSFEITINPQYYKKRMSDSLQVLFTSYFDEPTGKLLSKNAWVKLDDVVFEGEQNDPVFTINNNLSNGDFKLWSNLSGVNVPQGWFTSIGLDKLSTTQLTQTQNGVNNSSALTLGIDPNLNPTNIYTNFKPTSLDQSFVSGFAKFNLSLGDTVVAYVSKYSESEEEEEIILAEKYFTGSSSTFEVFNLDIKVKFKLGDTLVLNFYAYNEKQFGSQRLSAMSSFTLDDVSLRTSILTDLTTQNFNASSAVFPNPSANGIYYFANENDLNEIKVYDSFGKEVSKKVNLSDQTLDISANPKGVYTIKNQDRVIKLVY